MRVNVIHPAELGATEIESWHRLQRATPSLGHPFLSPEYAITVGRYRPESRVAVLTDGNDAIGFFPFEKRQFGLGMPISGVGYRPAKAVRSTRPMLTGTHTTCYGNVVSRPGGSTT